MPKSLIMRRDNAVLFKNLSNNITIPNPKRFKAVCLVSRAIVGKSLG